MAQIPNPISSKNWAISLKKEMEFQPVAILPGAEMKMVRESPTSAVIKFKAGSVEPSHHHTFGYELVVMKGKKNVWNLEKNESHELGEGDYLFMPAGVKHRAYYSEDTEFFIRWEGDWDIIMDESLEAAADAVKAALKLEVLVDVLISGISEVDAGI